MTKQPSEWPKLLKPANLTKHGKTCSSINQMARSMKVSRSALISAYQRWIPDGPGLSSYLGQTPPTSSEVPPLLHEDLVEAGKEAKRIEDVAIALSKKLGVTVSIYTIRRQIAQREDLQPLGTYVTKSPTKTRRLMPEDISFPMSDERKRAIREAKRLVVTSALNNTDVHIPAWASLQRYAKELEAEIIVIPLRYRNPTSPDEKRADDADAWWPDEVLPYMTDDLIEVHEHLLILANARIAATAIHPLSGLNELSKSSSAIIGHSQLAMHTVPVPQRRQAKVMWSTGSISQRRYSESRAGIRAQFHHSIGALVVERDGPRFYCRPLVIEEDDGTFYDLDRYYHPKGSRKSKSVPALIIGDEHAMFADPETMEATFYAKDSIVNTLRPEKLIRHDVMDFFSGSHHTRNDPVIQFAKHEAGVHRVADELKHTREYIDKTTPSWSESVVVASNHHDHLLKWLKEVTPHDEPWNAKVWVELWGELVLSARMTDTGVEHVDPFAAWMKTRLKSNVRFLARDDHEVIKEIICGFHSDKGVNGSRGSALQFSKMGARTVIGHGHSPKIMQGCWQVGVTARRDMTYANDGPSSWAVADVVIHPNGKRQMIFVIGPHWRLS